jgi:DNA-binding ferritin-like protein
MNVEKNFFLQGVTSAAKATVRNTVGSSSVPIRIFWLGILIFIIIGLAFGLWWLAQQCTGYNAMYFEHFADASGETKTDVSGAKKIDMSGNEPPKTFAEFLNKVILKNLNDTKTNLMTANNRLDDIMEDLDTAKDNICDVLDDIQTNFVQSRLSGVDPTLAKQPKSEQDKKLAIRKERALKDWKRRKTIWTKRNYLPVVECFNTTGSDSTAVAIVQINTTCDDIEDTLANLQEQINSPDIQDVVKLFNSVYGGVQFSTPFLMNTAVVVSNNVSTIRNMAKPDVKPDAPPAATEDKAAAATPEAAAKPAATEATPATPAAEPTTEGFADIVGFMNTFTTSYSDVHKKYNDTINQASSVTRQINSFITMVDDLKKRTADSKELNKKIKKANKELKDGKVTPAYMDEKPK